MRYRTAKRIAKRLDAEARGLNEIGQYTRGQLLLAIIALRRHWLRGCSRRGDYRTRDAYFLANRVESRHYRLKFFPWQGRGRRRAYDPSPPLRKTFPIGRYPGLPYTSKGSLVYRKGIERPTP
jgi:hypothetical protein